jgi:hypothetical protein
LIRTANFQLTDNLGVATTGCPCWTLHVSRRVFPVSPLPRWSTSQVEYCATDARHRLCRRILTTALIYQGPLPQEQRSRYRTSSCRFCWKASECGGSSQIPPRMCLPEMSPVSLKAKGNVERHPIKSESGTRACKYGCKNKDTNHRSHRFSPYA